VVYVVEVGNNLSVKGEHLVDSVKMNLVISELSQRHEISEERWNKEIVLKDDLSSISRFVEKVKTSISNTSSSDVSTSSCNRVISKSNKFAVDK